MADEAVAEGWREATRAACRRLHAGADQRTTGYLVSLMQCEDALNVALLREADKANEAPAVHLLQRRDFFTTFPGSLDP